MFQVSSFALRGFKNGSFLFIIEYSLYYRKYRSYIAQNERYFFAKRLTWFFVSILAVNSESVMKSIYEKEMRSQVGAKMMINKIVGILRN